MYISESLRDVGHLTHPIHEDWTAHADMSLTPGKWTAGSPKKITYQ